MAPVFQGGGQYSCHGGIAMTIKNKNAIEFLQTVTEQIRCRRVRDAIVEELENHILDQAQDYMDEGMEKECAMESAVRDMGDPVEIGAALDRIHRPRTSWGIIALAGIISLFSLALHAALASAGADWEGDYYFRRQLGYTVVGFALMLLIYRMDYSFLRGRSRYIALGFMAFIIGGTLLRGTTVHGAYRYIRLTQGIHIPVCTVILLLVPVYGAILYDYRGCGYSILWKMFLWAAVPVLFILQMPSLTTAIVMGMSFAILFSVAVAKDWFHVNKKAVLAVLWFFICLVPAGIIGMALSADGERPGLLAAYQIQRLRTFVNINSANAENYAAVKIKQIMQNSYLTGRNTENLNRVLNELPDFNSDYVFVSIMAAYGILAACLAAALLLGIIGKTFHMSFKQKNQLGMITGCGCGVVFLIQTLLSIMVNLNLMPNTSTTLPFFCFGGGSTIVSYILLGLVLSIYRYKDILIERPAGEMQGRSRISVKISIQNRESIKSI